MTVVHCLRVSARGCIAGDVGGSTGADADGGLDRLPRGGSGVSGLSQDCIWDGPMAPSRLPSMAPPMAFPMAPTGRLPAAVSGRRRAFLQREEMGDISNGTGRCGAEAVDPGVVRAGADRPTCGSICWHGDPTLGHRPRLPSPALPASAWSDALETDK